MWDYNVKNPVNLRKHVSLKVVCLVNQGEILSYGFKLVKSDNICLQLANLVSHIVSTYNWQTICDKGEWKKVTEFASTCRWCHSFQLQCLHVLRLGLFIRYALHFVFFIVPLILNFYGVILQMKFQEFLLDTTILIKHGWNFKSFGTKEFQKTCETAYLEKKFKTQTNTGYNKNKI